MLTENTNQVSNTGRDVLMFILLIALVVIMLAGVVGMLKIA